MSRPSSTTRKYTCKTMLACPHHHANKFAPLYISNSSDGRKLCFASAFKFCCCRSCTMYRLSGEAQRFRKQYVTISMTTASNLSLGDLYPSSSNSCEWCCFIVGVFFLESSGLGGISWLVLNVTEYNGAAFLVLDCYDSMHCSFVVLSVLMHLTLTYISYALLTLRWNEKSAS